MGQLGTGLAKLLRKSYGPENVILSDIIKPSKEILDDGKNYAGGSGTKFPAPVQVVRRSKQGCFLSNQYRTGWTFTAGTLNNV